MKPILSGDYDDLFPKIFADRPAFYIAGDRPDPLIPALVGNGHSAVSKAYTITPEMLRALLRYNQDTGNLYWRERGVDLFEDGKHSAEHNKNAWNAKNAGREALAYVGSQGYLQGAIFGRRYLAHRVIWAMETGVWPTDQIDHVDGDRIHNRMQNLREVTNSENARNAKLYETNTSGVVGVSWYKKTQKWQAYIKIGGSQRNLGLFASKAEAISARKAAEKEHGFHRNHGRIEIKKEQNP